LIYSENLEKSKKSEDIYKNDFLNEDIYETEQDHNEESGSASGSYIESEEINFKPILNYAWEMFGNFTLVVDHVRTRGKKNKFHTMLESQKTKMNFSWIIIRFCQACGIVLSSDAAQFILRGKSFELSFADIINFVACY